MAGLFQQLIFIILRLTEEMKSKNKELLRFIITASLIIIGIIIWGRYIGNIESDSLLDDTIIILLMSSIALIGAGIYLIYQSEKSYKTGIIEDCLNWNWPPITPIIIVTKADKYFRIIDY